MKWEQLRAQLKQVGRELRERFSRLTDDDLLLLKVKKELLIAKLQERAGRVKDEVARRLGELLGELDLDEDLPRAVAPVPIANSRSRKSKG